MINTDIRAYMAIFGEKTKAEANTTSPSTMVISTPTRRVGTLV